MVPWRLKFAFIELPLAIFRIHLYSIVHNMEGAASIFCKTAF
jgi:hypothetical protein